MLGYCIAYFLVVKVKSPGWRLVLFLAFIVPFWTSTLIRAIAWVPFLGVNGVINQTLMFVAPPSRRSRRSSIRAPASPWRRSRSTP